MKKHWAKIKDADRRNMVGRYSALLIQVRDNRDWSEPVDVDVVKSSAARRWLNSFRHGSRKSNRATLILIPGLKPTGSRSAISSMSNRSVTRERTAALVRFRCTLTASSCFVKARG
jgi:hypothetical protein